MGNMRNDGKRRIRGWWRWLLWGARPGAGEPGSDEALPARGRVCLAGKKTPPVEHIMHPANQFLRDTPEFLRVRPWHIGLLMGLVALGLYAATACWVPSTRASMAFLVRHLGSDYSVPLLDVPWDLWARFAIKLPWFDLSAWTAALCACMGAASVGLLTWLLARTAFFYTPDAPDSSIRREAVARRISGIAGGAYLMVAGPFWWSSTRAMPGTLLTLWLLLAAMFFSFFQRTGRRGWFACMSFLWGLGCAWNIDFWLLAPIVLFLALREIIRWRLWANPMAYLALVVPGLAGAACSYFVLRWSWRHGGYFLYGDWESLLRAFGKAQVAGLGLNVALTPFLVLMSAVAFVPWWILFGMSRRSPWFYERGQVLLRVLLAAHLIILFFNVPYAPWRMLGGNDDPFLVPVLVLAGCAGYLAGEFWCLGQVFAFKDHNFWRRFGKRAMAFLALVAAPAFLAVGGIYAGREILRGRAGAYAWQAANDALDARGDRMVFFPNAFFDDALALAAEERGETILMFREPSRCSPLFLKGLGRAVPPLADMMANGSTYPQIMAAFLQLPHGAESSVLLPGPEYVRNFVDIVPCGYAWHPHPRGSRATAKAGANASAVAAVIQSVAGSTSGASAGTVGPVHPADILAREQPFYGRLAVWREKDLEKNSLEWYCREVLCSVAARSANDLSIELAREGLLDQAREAAVSASKIDTGNLSARLNAAQFQAMQGAPSAAPGSASAAAAPLLESWPGLPSDSPVLADLHALATRDDAARSRSWSLFANDGLVAAPDAWILRGLPWAVSGRLPSPDAISGATPARILGMLPASPAATWFQCALASIGNRPLRPDEACGMMVADSRNPDILAELARTYLMQGRPDLAVGTLEAALELLPSDATGFPLEELLTDAALAGLLPYQFPPHQSTLDAVPAPSNPHFPRRWTSPDGLPMGLRAALLQVASVDPSDIRPWVAIWMLEPTSPYGSLANDKFRVKARNDPGLALTLATALQESGDRTATAKSFSVIRPYLHKLASHPVTWRIICRSAAAANDRISARRAYARLSQYLTPVELASSVPIDALYELPSPDSDLPITLPFQ